jgi:hypothetical protein
MLETILKEIIMTTTNRPFAVHKTEVYWDADTFETLEKAQEYARKEAYTGGCDFYIYKAIAKAEKPAKVNEVKITEV